MPSVSRLFLCATLLTPACALGTHGGVGLGGPTGAQAQLRTRDYALLGGPKSQSEGEGRLARADDEHELNEKALTGSFWGGVIVGSVGTAMAVGFGAAGAVSSQRLEDAYVDGTTAEDRDQIVTRGEAFNALAITGATLAITGWAVAAIAHGIDYTRCGPRRRKRDGCTAN